VPRQGYGRRSTLAWRTSVRGLDPAQLGRLTDLGWILEHLNVLLMGPTGVGKSFIYGAKRSGAMQDRSALGAPV